MVGVTALLSWGSHDVWLARGVSEGNWGRRDSREITGIMLIQRMEEDKEKIMIIVHIARQREWNVDPGDINGA
jgi:hypothetical protein